jgi:hypothetical protein
MVSKQNPVITTVGTCEVQDLCGTIKWGVSFSLPQPAATCGWIIQMITVNSPSEQVQFWEAFYIPAGAQTTMGIYSQGSGPPVDDTYFSKHLLNTKGTDTTQGIARFYEGTLPSDFVYCDLPGGGSPAGGARRFTRTQPPWWDGQGTPHDITIMWDCTNMPTTCSVQTDPPNACASPCQ